MITEAPSCGKKEFGRNGHLSIAARDRLRLAVAIAGGDEIHSWAAASRFDARSIFEIVSTGPMSTGSFGTYLVNVFQNPAARFKYTDRKGGGPQEVFEYVFEVPVEGSQYSIKVGNELKVTGFHGLVQIYAATADLALLIEETNELPPESGMCLARTSIDYHTVLIGDGPFLFHARPNSRRSRRMRTRPTASLHFQPVTSITLNRRCDSTAAIAPRPIPRRQPR